VSFLATATQPYSPACAIFVRDERVREPPPDCSLIRDDHGLALTSSVSIPTQTIVPPFVQYQIRHTPPADRPRALTGGSARESLHLYRVTLSATAEGVQHTARDADSSRSALGFDEGKHRSAFLPLPTFSTAESISEHRNVNGGPGVPSGYPSFRLPAPKGGRVTPPPLPRVRDRDSCSQPRKPAWCARRSDLRSDVHC